jgi:hypothetical protein
MTKKRIWIARDECNDLRAYWVEPEWVSADDNNGYFYSESENWQIDVDAFANLSKGEKKVVVMNYTLEEIS